MRAVIIFLALSSFTPPTGTIVSFSITENNRCSAHNYKRTYSLCRSDKFEIGIGGNPEVFYLVSGFKVVYYEINPDISKVESEKADHTAFFERLPSAKIQFSGKELSEQFKIKAQSLRINIQKFRVEVILNEISVLDKTGRTDTIPLRPAQRTFNFIVSN